MNLLYIPAEIYTPFNHKYSSGNVPWKGHPYYFKMYLTFFLQEQGINVSYLVNKDDMNESVLKKAIKVVERYKQGKNLPSGNSLSAGHYPRNEKQEEIIKFFIYFIDWMENYKLGKKWLNSIRKRADIKPDISLIGDYFVNVTSNKTPNYLIVANKEELNQILRQTDYKLVLSLPLL